MWNIIKKETRKLHSVVQVPYSKIQQQNKNNMEYYKERDRESTFSGTGSIQQNPTTK